MPQLEREERKVLAAVHPYIALLITERISGELDSRKITDLDVSNDLRFLKYETDRIPLCLTERHDLPQEDYEQLLKLLEGLINEDVLRQHTTLTGGDDDGLRNSTGADEQEIAFSIVRYPKLVALINQASRVSIPDLSALLRLPPTASELKEAVQIVTAFNNKNAVRSKAITQSDVSEICPAASSHRAASDKPRSRTKLESVKRSQKCLSDLWRALVENINSKCTPAHVAKLQVRHPEGIVEPIDGFQHRIFVSYCSLQNRWQEITCKIVPQLPVNSKLRKVSNICDVVQHSFDNGKTLQISVHESRIVHDVEAARRTKLPAICPTLSLDAILRDTGQNLRRYHRLVLALNLSHALLRIYQAGMQDEWTSRDIFFLFNSSNNKVVEAYNPYLAYSLQERGSGNLKLAAPRKFPLLIAFGKVLLEIALGRPVEDSELQKLHHRPDVAMLALAEVEIDKLEDKVGPSYINAMTECLVANQDNDYDGDEGVGGREELAEESKCRDVLFTVVDDLESARSTECRPHRNRQRLAWKDPNYEFELEVSKDVHREDSDARLSSLGVSLPAANILRELTSPPMGFLLAPETMKERFSELCAADGTPYAPSDRSQCIAADNWKSDFKKILGRHKPGRVSSERRLKVAVLDSGIDLRHRDFTGNTQIKGVETWVGNDVHDTDGHGTHIAGLILELTQNVDLYIGKVTDSKDHLERYSEQIAQAIKHARETWGVHMISLSLGFTQPVPNIHSELLMCLKNDIVVFAAASNDAGNAPEAYPAKWHPILCIYSATAYGNKSSKNPTPNSKKDKFMVVGECIKSSWLPTSAKPDMRKYMSGTSFAVPVAVSIAALMIGFIDRNMATFTGSWLTPPRSPDGVRKIFKLMVEDSNRDGYEWLNPKWFFENYHPEKILGDIKQELGLY